MDLQEQVTIDKTKEALTMATDTMQEAPITISQDATEVLTDQRFHMNRKMNEDLPQVFQIDAINVAHIFESQEPMPKAYNRMRTISVKMTLAAMRYRAAVKNHNTVEMQMQYTEAEELQRQFYNAETETVVLHESTEEATQLPPAVIELHEPRPGYFARKKAKKQEKKAKDERGRQLEREFGESYRQTAKVSSGQELDIAIIQSDYVKELILPKKTLYKNEQGEEVTTTQRELMEKAMGGDYSRLEQLEPALRNVLAAKFMKDNKAVFTGNPEQDALALETRFPGGLMQPLLRLGISLGMRQCLGDGQQSQDYYKRLDAWMNAKIMRNTLAPFRHQDKVGDGKDFSQEDVIRNAQSQLFIAKTMFMCHMGTFTLKNTKEQQSGTWEGPVANAFAHCSRVGIVLPGMEESSYSKEGERRIVDSYTGDNGGLSAGFFVRGGATHTLFRKSKDKGLIKTGFKELKFFSPFHQRGMNVAVGGLGNNGITGPDGTERILKNDGSCGHIYMHLEEGDGSNYTSMLVGFESDSYKKTNQLGHTHGFGNGEFASSFGGQRLDEIGDKYGGRNLDLTNINAVVFRNVMQKFEANYMRLQTDALTNPAAMAELQEMNRKLCGARMSKTELRDFIHSHMAGAPGMSDADIDSLS